MTEYKTRTVSRMQTSEVCFAQISLAVIQSTLLNFSNLNVVSWCLWEVQLLLCPWVYQAEISFHCIWWIAMKNYIGIHVPQRMNPTDVSDTLTFPFAPPWGLHLRFCVNYLDNYWMACCDIFLQIVMVHKGYILVRPVPLTFNLTTSRCFYHYGIWPNTCKTNR